GTVGFALGPDGRHEFRRGLGRVARGDHRPDRRRRILRRGVCRDRRAFRRHGAMACRRRHRPALQHRDRTDSRRCRRAGVRTDRRRRPDLCRHRAGVLMRRLLLSLAICLLPLAALSQEDAAETERDRDFLTAYLEDHLSSLGRIVRIEGFRGALSSRATFDELTIADDEGVWITVRNGAIGWKRSALLAGRVEISEMSAAEIDLPRAPGSAGPSAEA